MPPNTPKMQRIDVEQPGDQHQGEEARDDEVLDRVDAEHLQRVELLADLAGAEVGGDRRAGDAGEHDRVDERRELADRREHEETAEPVERAEQDQEVGGLETRRLVAEGDRSRSAAGTSTASSRTGTGRRTRCRTGTAVAPRTRASGRSGSSCCRPLPARIWSAGTLGRRLLGSTVSAFLPGGWRLPARAQAGTSLPTKGEDPNREPKPGVVDALRQRVWPRGLGGMFRPR